MVTNNNEKMQELTVEEKLQNLGGIIEKVSSEKDIMKFKLRVS